MLRRPVPDVRVQLCSGGSYTGVTAVAVPLARPSFAGLLKAVELAVAKNHPARGERA